MSSTTPRRAGHRRARSERACEPARAAQRGLFLFELLLGLMVVALGVGLGASLLQKQAEAQRVETTRARAEVILRALGAHVATHGRLPCPASNATTVPLAQLGSEHVSTDPLDSTVWGTSCASRPHGVVPWATIGLQRRDVEDGYGRLFGYQVAPALTATGLTSVASFCAQTPDAARSAALAGGVESTRADRLAFSPLVYTAANPGDPPTPVATSRVSAGELIPFVLLSHGQNQYAAFRFATDENEPAAGPRIAQVGDAVVPTNLPSERINASGSGVVDGTDTDAIPGLTNYWNFIDRNRSFGNTDPFDDLLFYRGRASFVANYAGSVCAGGGAP